MGIAVQNLAHALLTHNIVLCQAPRRFSVACSAMAVCLCASMQKQSRSSITVLHRPAQCALHLSELVQLLLPSYLLKTSV